MHTGIGGKATLFTTCILLAMLAGGPARGQQSPQAATKLEVVPETPSLPGQVESGEALEPEVTIIESAEERIEQFSVNGRVYMVKITPKTAPPYYLVDTDGNGSLETRRRELDSDLLIPHWVLYRW